MTVKISDETTKQINEIAKSYGLKVIFNPRAKFQGESNKQKKEITLKSEINTEDFDRLFQQLGQDFDIKHDQEMFIFNLFHEIGHFEKDLWPLKHEDKIVQRLENLRHDKIINKWAFQKLQEIKQNFSH